MKKKHSLPIEMTPCLCDERLVFSHAIIRGVVKDNLQALLYGKYINCYFREDDIRQELNIAMHDPWFTEQGIMEQQTVNLLKETYQKGKINLISMIKKSLLYDSYVLGQCNRAYIESETDENAPLLYYAVTGFDDIKHEFTVCGLDSSYRFLNFSVDMQRFVEALYDTPLPHITLTLWKYNVNAPIVFDLDNVIFELEDYLNSENRRNHNKWHKIYGLAAFEELCKSLQKHFEDGEAINLSYLHVFALHKSYMRERIEYLILPGVVNGNFLACAETVEELAQEVQDLGKIANQTHKAETLNELIVKIRQIMSMEREYLTNVLCELKNIKMYK